MSIYSRKKIVAGITAVVGCCIALSLLSFSIMDPTWVSAYGAVDGYYNLLGAYGAEIAATLFFVFGSGAYVLAGALLFVAYFVACKQWSMQEIDRVSAWSVLLFALSAASALYGFGAQGPYLAGGLLGNYCAAAVSWLLGAILAKLFALTIVWSSTMLVARDLLVPCARHVWYAYCVCIAHRHYVMTALRYLCMGITYLYCALRWCLQKIIQYVQWLHESLCGQDEVNAPSESLFDVVTQAIERDVRDDSFWHAHTTRDAYNVPEAAMHDEVESATTVCTSTASDRVSSVTQETRHGACTETVRQVTNEKKQYELPPQNCFSKTKAWLSDDVSKEEQQLATVLEEKLARFGIKGTVVSIKSGPVLTLFEYQPDIDAKVSKILALEDDLGLALQAVSIRIIAPIPGTSVVGFEVSKKERDAVLFSSIAHSSAFKNNTAQLPLVLGHSTIGQTVIVDLAKMPHLLIAGSTGAGKSVALNTMLMSLLCHMSPEKVRLVLVDPKRLEFASYENIPHLLFPIITDPHKVVPVLQWVVRTMEQRYKTMAACGVRQCSEYQALHASGKVAEPMPYIVVMIDELADLMMSASKEVEVLIARIAQMARAAGIHMIVATQRPSVDVITGLIKVNFPSRISFRVTSKVDSRTILDEMGAEKLLGRGDMLFLDSSQSVLKRIHGAYVSDDEIAAVVNHIRKQRMPDYVVIDYSTTDGQSELRDVDDQLYKEVLEYLDTIDEVSISSLQRRFRIGYNRSARIIEILEHEGRVLASDGGKMRKIIH